MQKAACSYEQTAEKRSTRNQSIEALNSIAAWESRGVIPLGRER